MTFFFFRHGAFGGHFCPRPSGGALKTPVKDRKDDDFFTALPENLRRKGSKSTRLIVVRPKGAKAASGLGVWEGEMGAHV